MVSNFGYFILVELILPVQEERPVCVTLGVLLCLRHLVPHLSDAMSSQNFKGNVSIIQNEEDMWVTKEQILKVRIVLIFRNIFKSLKLFSF